MTYQRMLFRLLSSGVLRRLGLGQQFLHGRPWTIESGEGVGLQLKLPQNLDYISGASEIPVQKALAQEIRKGDVFYDVGANMGFFSLIASRRVGPNGCVCSFEPVAENIASIRENIALNRLENVRLFELAVGRNSGTDELLLTGWDGGSTLATSSVKPGEPIARRTVRVVALDELIKDENLRAPNFVKIDVEGVELDVLRGMAKTLAETRPAVLYEVDDGSRESFAERWQELDDYISSFDYRIVRLEDSYANTHWNVGHTLALPGLRKRA